MLPCTSFACRHCVHLCKLSRPFSLITDLWLYRTYMQELIIDPKKPMQAELDAANAVAASPARSGAHPDTSPLGPPPTGQQVRVDSSKHKPALEQHAHYQHASPNRCDDMMVRCRHMTGASKRGQHRPPCATAAGWAGCDISGPPSVSGCGLKVEYILPGGGCRAFCRDVSWLLGLEGRHTVLLVCWWLVNRQGITMAGIGLI